MSMTINSIIKVKITLIIKEYFYESILNYYSKDDLVLIDKLS